MLDEALNVYEITEVSSQCQKIMDTRAKLTTSHSLETDIQFPMYSNIKV